MKGLHVGQLLPLALLLLVIGAAGDKSEGNLFDCKVDCTRAQCKKIEYDGQYCDKDAYNKEGGTFLCLVLAAIMFLFILWFPLRLCCNCCGGKFVTPDSCCTGANPHPEFDDESMKKYEQDEQQRYFEKMVCSPFHPRCLKFIFNGWVLLLAVLALIITSTGSAKINDGSEQVWKDAKDAVNNIFNPHLSEEGAHESLPKLLKKPDGTYIQYQAQTTETIVKETTEARDKAMKSVNDNEDDYKKPVEEVLTPLGVVFALLPFPTAVVLFLMGCCNCGKNHSNCGNCLLHILLGLVWLLGVVTWLLAGVLVTFKPLTRDTCYELDQMGGTPPVYDGLVAWGILYETCQTDILEGTKRESRQIADGIAAGRACVELKQLCSASLVDSNPFYCPDEARYGAGVAGCNSVKWQWPDQQYTFNISEREVWAYELKNSFVGQRGSCGIPCTLRECATQCDPTLRNRLANLMTFLDEANRTSRASLNHVEVLLDCGNTFHHIGKSLGGSCKDIKEGAELWVAGLLFAALSLSFAFVAIWLGIKRFIPKEDIPTASPVKSEPYS